MRTTNTNLKRLFLTGAVVGTLFLIPVGAQAGNWFFSLHVPFYGGTCWSPPVYYDEPLPYGPDYYPIYNPVVERDVYYGGHRHWNGTVHTDRTVEDRHATYYSPGRNEAITPPRTTVRRRYGPGYNETQERTSWIGADGLPHSTTIRRTTTRDFWGNAHTDTHVTLKNRRGGNTPPSPSIQPKAPGSPKVPVTPKTPRNKVPGPVKK